jgi:hypothetical protein
MSSPFLVTEKRKLALSFNHSLNFSHLQQPAIGLENFRTIFDVFIGRQ